MVIKTDNTVIIFEFKVVEGEGIGEGKGRGNTALEQIKNKRYYDKYLGLGKGIYLVGMEFSKIERNITKFDWELINS